MQRQSHQPLFRCGQGQGNPRARGSLDLQPHFHSSSSSRRIGSRTLWVDGIHHGTRCTTRGAHNLERKPKRSPDPFVDLQIQTRFRKDAIDKFLLLLLKICW